MAHTPYSKLAEKLQEAKKKVKVGGIYFHHKNPDVLYKVIDLAFQESDESLCVVYHNLENSEIIFVRNLEGEKGFLTPERVNEKEIKRFEEKN